MNEQRQQAYRELIQALLQCAEGEETEILAANEHLIDAGLIETIHLVAADFDKQENNISGWLRNLAQHLVQYVEPIQPSQAQFAFCREVMEIIGNGAKPEQVYYLIRENIDKIDLGLAQVFQMWADKILPTLTVEGKQLSGYVVKYFSDLIQKFPLGNYADNIDIAITGYHIVLTIFTKSAFPEEWAATQNNLAISYNQRIRGNRAKNLEQAIEHAQNALQIRTKAEFPLAWAMTQCNLANIYRERIRENKAENLEQAIKYAQNALNIYSETNFPEQWATIQNNLAGIYIERIKENKAENLEQAIECYKLALHVFTKRDFPVDWAMTQNNLGAVYCLRIKGNKAENLEQAIECYRLALEIRTKADFPVDWAMTQNNLANIYNERIKGYRAENLEQAIECCRLALEIRTKADFPVDWAMTQNNLANIYNERTKGNRAENLEWAIKYAQNALAIYTKADFPLDWARTQNSLALFYGNRIGGKKADNLEQAINCYQLALDVLTKSDFPLDWAMIQLNLGNICCKIHKENQAWSIEQAIKHYQNALSIYTKDDFPADWAGTQNGLGNAYTNRTKGNRDENIERAIYAYSNSLEIYTPQKNPITQFQYAYNLGSLHFTEGNWLEAIDAYTTAIEAVEQSREWASNDYNKQEIISNAMYVYKDIVQACVNTAQIDQALEFVERGKARNLVDLLATRDLYPKGDIPQKIINRLDELRQKVIAEEKRLRQQSNYKCDLDANTSTADNRDITAATASQNAALDRTYLNSLRQQLEQLVAEEIQPIDPAFQLTQRVKPIKFEQIKATLPTEQTALIEWFIGDGTLSAFIVTRQQATPIYVNYSEEQFSNLVKNAEQYYNSYRQRDGEWHNNLPNLLSQLAQNLQLSSIIEQTKQIIPYCNRIILVPHRWLHLLPIHALPIDDGKCLLDLFDYGVSYAPSVQLLELTQKQARKNQGEKQDKNFFAVQNPTEDLEYTDIEVKTIRSQFTPNDEVLKTKEATKSALTKERLSKANLSHFSCHGSFNFENPELSALHLASSKVQEKTKQDLVAIATKTRFLPDRDGSYIDLEQCLTLGEIFGLDLRNCGLVTLSACETGLTDFRSLSDEYIGLPSGFLFAGSPSVVSSLWAVNDLSTSFLMIKFYQNLQQMDSVPIALNKAQLWLRSLTRKEFVQWSKNLPLRGIQRAEFEAKFVDNEHPFASPYHWAAFCAVGS